jgi:hypothetical protein
LLTGAKLFALEMGIGWLEDCIDGATSFDKKHKTVIPLGVDDTGDSIYTIIAQNHFGSKIGAALMAGANGNFFGKDSFASNIWDISPYKRSNLNALIMGSYDLLGYLFESTIPYDYFRGKLAFPEYIKKGQGGWKSFAAYEWGELGGDLFYDPYKNLFSDTTYDKLTSFFPFNTIEALIRKTDYGHQEDNNNNSSSYGY